MFPSTLEFNLLLPLAKQWPVAEQLKLGTNKLLWKAQWAYQLLIVSIAFKTTFKLCLFIIFLRPRLIFWCRSLDFILTFCKSHYFICSGMFMDGGFIIKCGIPHRILAESIFLWTWSLQWMYDHMTWWIQLQISDIIISVSYISGKLEKLQRAFKQITINHTLSN